MIERVTESFVKAMGWQKSTRAAVGTPRLTGGNCNFCGSPEHFIWECQVVLDYIREGKCKRNIEGKVVLPSGMFLPRDVAGLWLCDRFDVWHMRNPNQTVAVQMMY